MRPSGHITTGRRRSDLGFRRLATASIASPCAAGQSARHVASSGTAGQDPTRDRTS